MRDRAGTQRALSVHAAAETHAAVPAIVTKDQTITYAELAGRVRARAAAISAAAPDRPSGIAIVASLEVETLVTVYALFELGVPAVLLHPRLTPKEREALVGMVGATLLPDVLAAAPAAALPATPPLPAPPDPEEPLAILFTSGTSGTPKGVALSRRAFLASADGSAANLGWRDGDRWVLSMPLGHVGGLSVVVRCLVARKTVVLAPWTGSIGALLDDIERLEVTLVSFVPTMLRKVLDDRPDYAFPARVRAVLLGGDAASPRLLEDCAARGVPALTTYGLTEACSQVATQLAGETPSASAGVGRPLPGVEVRIADGEIQVRGATLMSGYVPRERWPSPLLEGGWFPTGDLGVLDEEGRLHVRGRRSARIITGGENVDPLEVEQVLMAFPGVRDACVFGVADETWGQTVAAAVVPFERDLELPALAAWVEERLAKFKRPRAVAVAPALPQNATGKTDRAAVAASLGSRLVPLRASNQNVP